LAQHVAASALRIEIESAPPPKVVQGAPHDLRAWTTEDLCAFARQYKVQIKDAVFYERRVTGQLIACCNSASDVLILLDLSPRHYIECARLASLLNMVQSESSSQPLLPPPDSPVWSHVTLCNWLSEHGFSDVANAFELNRVSGDVFQCLDTYMAASALLLDPARLLEARIALASSE
jgi:hypothetical protein